MAKAVSNLVTNVVTKAPIWAREVGQPKLQTFLKYAKVELIPPSPAEIPEITSGIQKLLSGARTGKWKQMTVKEGWLNTLVAVEVICWFYIGECIGKRHIVGYKV